MTDYGYLEAGYTAREVAIARETIGADALAGVGYGSHYRVALLAARIALRGRG